MIGEATYIACRRKHQLLPSTKQELPAWIYVRGKVQFKSMCCLEGIECTNLTSTLHKLLKYKFKIFFHIIKNQCSEMLAADWLRLSCRVGGGGGGREWTGTQQKHHSLSLLSSL
jgi:hypothetical protein